MSIAKGLKQLGFENLVDFSLVENGDGIVEIEGWYSESPQPSDEAIETASAEWQAEYDSNAWSRARQSAYPSWQEQMDMMYHDQTEGSRTWLDAIEAVKEAHPK